MTTETPLLLTVSEYIASLNAALESIPAKVTGEIIHIKRASSGHMYFSLKDTKENAVIDCAMWSSYYRQNGVQLTEGMEVILSGSANIYAPFGKLSFITKTVELVGEGALKKAYDDLKRKLTQEGIFSPQRKRQLPAFSQQIGIITSKTGAVIHDFANNVGKHGYTFHFIDSRVEGKEALFDILQAIKTMRKQEIDLLVIMRGGGSLQSLAAFDSEAIVRAIATFPVPVIAAIGHHQDVPLTNMAADVDVSTPTAAANIVSRSWDQAERSLERDAHIIFSTFQKHIHDISLSIHLHKQTLSETFRDIMTTFQKLQTTIYVSLSRAKEAATTYNGKLTYLFAAITKNMDVALQRTTAMKTQGQTVLQAYSQTLKTIHTSLVHCEQIIDLNNPLRLLQHGYSIVQQRGVLVKEIKDVRIGNSIDVLVSDGTIISRVETTQET